MMLAPLLVLLSQVPAPLSGTAVDREGRPLAGVEIVLAWGQAADGTVPMLGRATTDSRGRYTIAVPTVDRRSPRRNAPHIAAYRPDSGLVASVALLKQADPGEYPLTFHPAGRRTFTLRGDDGRPLAGVRLAPIVVRPRQPGYEMMMLPDALADRMAATTGHDGRAELACLEPTTELAGVRVDVPGLGRVVFALTPEQIKSEVVELDLKRAGRMSGRVVHEDGKPAADVEIEVWSGASGSVPLRPVRFEAGPLRTGEDGTFRTPAALLAGMKHRALVCAPGFKPVLTEWITPEPEGGADAVRALPEVVLKPSHDLVGRVIDRQGRPVAGAEVVAGGEGVSAATDDMGRFRLAGLSSERSLLVVRREGFRIDGRLLAPREREVEVVLARFEEPATRPLSTLGSPISTDERRRLARRVLEPFLVKVLAKGGDSPKAWALRSLMTFDPGAALEALERTTFQKTDHYQSFLRSELTRAMARDDPEEAAAVATSIPEAFRRAQALVGLCVTLPDDQRTRKREFVGQVLLAARAEPEPKLKLWQLGEAAELLLDLGEADRARAVFAEGRPIAEKVGSTGREFLGYFASRLARVDLPAALALVGGIDRAETHAVEIGNIAARIAASDPAEAERLAGAIRAAAGSGGVTLRICQNMARADLVRARRIAVGNESPMIRAGALIFAAYGLPSSERSSARDLVRQALGEMDQARDQYDRYRVNPAAYMPLVESIDPALVPELFWRAVADLAVDDDPRVEHGRDDVLSVALLLARYDRQVASVLFEPAARANSARAGAGNMIPTELVLLGVIDPRRAVEAVEALPDPGNLEAGGVNWSRIILADRLGRDPAGQWHSIWSNFSGLGGILSQRDILH